MQTTTQELYDRFALAADMHDNFVTPLQFAYMATQENLALALFLAKLGWTQNVKTQTITVTGAEAGAFPLTEDPLAIVAVHQVRSNVVRPVHWENYVDFMRQIPGATVSVGDPESFRAFYDADNDRTVLNFYPEPPAGTVLLVSYIPEPKKLTLDASPSAGFANSVSYPMGWEEWIVLGVAEQALDKEESDVSSILRRKAKLEQAIEGHIHDRMLAEHPTIRNLDAEHRGWKDKVVYPPVTRWWFR